MQVQSCGLIGTFMVDCSVDQVNVFIFVGVDDGNFNYNKGDFFIVYFKGSYELLLIMLGEGLKFMGCFNWLKDFKVDDICIMLL